MPRRGFRRRGRCFGTGMVGLALVAIAPVAGCEEVDGPSGGASDAAGGALADATQVEGEPSELSGITRLHNDVRAAVGVPPLAWDPRLAAIAAAWAAQCVDQSPPAGLIDHNDNRSDGYPSYVGENVYASSGNATASGAVDSWASERADYNYANNTCSGVCGHYTQVVWRTSTMLGCAKHSCSRLRFPSTIVCNYGPGGNSGGRPY